MALLTKYGRTYHFPFSPGTTSDDRINYQYWDDISQIPQLIHTEKLDGENNCLNRYGVFARSHAAPTVSPWTSHLRQKWELIKSSLGDLEVFGENLYAIHSIQYEKLESYYYVFGIRCLDKWLSWEETQFYANLLDFPTVPVLQTLKTPDDKNLFESEFLEMISHPGQFGTVDTLLQKSCTMEGVVTRSSGEYSISDFQKQVFKYVRKGHVKTDEHWTRNWKRAALVWEKKENN